MSLKIIYGTVGTGKTKKCFDYIDNVINTTDEISKIIPTIDNIIILFILLFFFIYVTYYFVQLILSLSGCFVPAIIKPFSISSVSLLSTTLSFRKYPKS